MAPLPCSPVSNSTASESHSLPASEESSDDSLSTPRPGPVDPAQRTAANLSRPLVPTYSASPDSVRLAERGIAKRDGVARRTSSDGQSAAHEVDGRPRNPYTYGIAESSVVPEATAITTAVPASSSPIANTAKHQLPELPSRLASPRRTSKSTLSPSQLRTSPHPDARRRIAARLPDDFMESSADESTAIIRRSSGKANYGAAEASTTGRAGDGTRARDGLASIYDQVMEDEHDANARARKKSPSTRSGGGASSTRDGDTARRSSLDGEGSRRGRESWLKGFAEKYGSVELENKGSVARDHLALERTFLAWLRTSLSFASIGIAVTQLFRLNTTITTPDGNQIHILASTAESLRQVGKPLGATFIGISILILLIGFHRYFESQHYVIRGKFPASRGSILLVTFVAAGLIVASLVVVVAVAPSAFEKR